MPKKTKSRADYLFEASWEVCNRIGGIYRVLESKAGKILDYYGKNYYLLGPYIEEKAKGEFQEEVPPKNFKAVFDDLEKEGIKCHFGKWLIRGEPNAILINFGGFWPQVNQVKKELWESYGIDSLFAGHDFNEPVLWSVAVAKLIERAAKTFKKRKIVAQFHEWLAGAGLLYLKKNGIKVGTIFTTHATVLGRTLAHNNIHLYSLLDKINPQKEVYRYGVQAKHQLEKAAAKHCTIFTTVSEITGIEAEYLLARKPDFLLPNGLDIEKFPTLEEVAIKHRIQKNRIREFLLFYFFPYYKFNIRKTLFYFVVGRYEFHNKGIDLFIKALGKLNKRLKEEKSSTTIVAFFWIPTQTQSIKEELVDSRENYRDIKDYLEEVLGEVKEHILYALVTGERFWQKTLFTDSKDFLKEVKKKRMRFKKKGLPPVCTHNLSDPNDVILKSFQENSLGNKEDDRIKVVFYPIYLTGSDGLLNLDYYESIQGSHLGVFPSFYEPWGYTALETAALGVSSVTTDLSGFGRFFYKSCKKMKHPGIFILERFNKTDEEIVKALSNILYSFSQLSLQERVENKIQARQMAALCDWQILIKNYIRAHNKALENTK